MYDYAEPASQKDSNSSPDSPKRPESGFPLVFVASCALFGAET